MIWLLSLVVGGMAYRFTKAVSECKWSMIWYGFEILALAVFIKSLVI